MTDIRRLFFGLEIEAPWPEQLPQGRLIDPEHRHLTFSFLGNTDYTQMEQALLLFPEPKTKLGYAALFDHSLFLPPRSPRCVSWHVHWLNRGESLTLYQKQLTQWLKERGFSPDSKHSFTPHVTLCRSTFNLHAWRKESSPLPLMASAIHLYESKGHSRYESLWSYRFVPPFKEIEHMADMAFLVRGEDHSQLFFHAAIALAFHFPPLTRFIPLQGRWNHLEEVIVSLNQLIAEVDGEIGCPFKAVSFHSQIEKRESWMEWEMIVDV